jgi:transposase
MIDKQTIFEIHRLHHLGWSHRKIARTLCIDRDTVKNYVNDPQRKFNRPKAQNLKLDPFRQRIQQWLEEDNEVKATVVLQRLHENGFDGQITIVRDLEWSSKKRHLFKPPSPTLNSFQTHLAFYTRDRSGADCYCRTFRCNQSHPVLLHPDYDIRHHRFARF